jgi:hypothetical protein
VRRAVNVSTHARAGPFARSFYRERTAAQEKISHAREQDLALTRTRSRMNEKDPAQECCVLVLLSALGTGRRHTQLVLCLSTAVVQYSVSQLSVRSHSHDSSFMHSDVSLFIVTRL